MGLRVFTSSCVAILLIGIGWGCKHDSGDATRQPDAAKKQQVLRLPTSRPMTRATTEPSMTIPVIGAEPTTRPVAPPKPPPLEAKWQTAPLPVKAEAVAVKEGPAPLVYM